MERAIFLPEEFYGKKLLPQRIDILGPDFSPMETMIIDCALDLDMIKSYEEEEGEMLKYLAKILPIVLEFKRQGLEKVYESLRKERKKV